jgi:sarcosine oxidase subunit beta
MNERAGVVVIGAGIIGTSIAYHLAKRGAGNDVIVLEQERVGSGTTSAAGGGIRSQFSTEVNIRFSLESVAFWRRWDEEIGLPVDYREEGYLLLATTPEEREQFKRNIALQNSLGVPSRFVEPEEAARILPGLFVDDLSGGAYNASDGRAGPNEAAQAFARRARDGGVRIREGVTVTGIDVEGGCVTGVRTKDSRIAAENVVIAAGPWSGIVGRMAGVDVQVHPHRRTIFVSEKFDLLPERFPVLMDIHAGWACTRDGDGIHMSGETDRTESFDRHIDWSHLATSAEHALHRYPLIAHARFGKKAYAGTYDTTPDNHAIVGEAPDVKGLFVCAGFSGHGFQHSPAAGRVVADLVLDGRAGGIDIAPLAMTRFKDGTPLWEPLTAYAATLGRPSA